MEHLFSSHVSSASPGLLRRRAPLGASVLECTWPRVGGASDTLRRFPGFLLFVTVFPLYSSLRQKDGDSKGTLNGPINLGPRLVGNSMSFSIPIAIANNKDDLDKVKPNLGESTSTCSFSTGMLSLQVDQFYSLRRVLGALR